MRAAHYTRLKLTALHRSPPFFFVRARICVGVYIGDFIWRSNSRGDVIILGRARVFSMEILALVDFWIFARDNITARTCVCVCIDVRFIYIYTYTGISQGEVCFKNTYRSPVLHCKFTRITIVLRAKRRWGHLRSYFTPETDEEPLSRFTVELRGDYSPDTLRCTAATAFYISLFLSVLWEVSFVLICFLFI